MIVEKTYIKDLIIVTPNVFMDDRGYFSESYNDKKLAHVIRTNFVQDNESLSHKNVLRGMHFQIPPFAQAKLLRVIKGSILDVAIDLRKKSTTYKQHFKFVFGEKNKKQLYIPVGFAHGFLCLENDTIINYKCSNYYDQESEKSIVWNDPDLGIDWGIEEPILSEKDTLAENFTTFDNPF
jgi:dTDP-4-dehydrorhamnose 3,5-epimerase